MGYLKGTHIEPKNSKGKLVQYLTKRAIDKSGRGYFSPEVAEIVGLHNRNIETDSGEFIHYNDIVEMVELTDFQKCPRCGDWIKVINDGDLDYHLNDCEEMNPS